MTLGYSASGMGIGLVNSDGFELYECLLPCDILEKSLFLEFHKVVRTRRHISGEVGKFTTYWCNVSSGLRIAYHELLLKSVHV